MNSGAFEECVFVNCPFDKEYLPLLKGLLFTVIRCGLVPRIALERFDSGEVRFDKIIDLIKCSRYSIHDLSRVKSQKKGEFARMNMPFEIGLDIGCRLFSDNSAYKSKRVLILEDEKYNYQKALSDISNSDVKCHNNDVEDLVYEVRTWFTEIGFKVPNGSLIWEDYNEFAADLMQRGGFNAKDHERMPVKEYIDFVSIWLAARQP